MYRLHLVTAFAIIAAGVAGGPSAPAQAAQTCYQSCYADACSGFTNAEKIQRGQCATMCRQKCTAPLPVTIVHPRFIILTIVYAPPGCTTTAAAKCAATSSVDYSDSSANGTKLSTSGSFKVGMSVSVDSKLPVGSSSASTGFTFSTTDTTSETITKTKVLDIKGSGNQDGVNHGQDTFVLLLNGEIAFQRSGTKVVWNLGKTGQVATVTASELQNPATMRPAVAQQLQALGFTNTDYQTILSADPYAAQTAIDPNRFTLTTWAFPYEPAVTSTDCNGGVCSCLAFSQTIKNDTLNDKSTTGSLDLTVSVTAGPNLSDVLSLKETNTLTITNSTTNDNTVASSQSATATIACPSPAYTGPIFMQIYWDSLYGSFVFVPLSLSQARIVHQGQVMDGPNKPARGELVKFAYGGKTYNTVTDGQGIYRIVVSASRLNGALTTGVLTVGETKQTVTLKDTKPVIVHLK